MNYYPFIPLKRDEALLMGHASSFFQHPSIFPCFVLIRDPASGKNRNLQSVLDRALLNQKKVYLAIPHEAEVVKKIPAGNVWLQNANDTAENYYNATKDLLKFRNAVPVYEIESSEDLRFAKRLVSELEPNRKIAFYIAAANSTIIEEETCEQLDSLFVNIKRNPWTSAMAIVSPIGQRIKCPFVVVRENRAPHITNRDVTSDKFGISSSLLPDLASDGLNAQVCSGFGDFCLLKNDLNEGGGDGKPKDIHLFAAIYDRSKATPARWCLHSDTKVFKGSPAARELQGKILTQLQNMAEESTQAARDILNMGIQSQARFHVLTAFHYLNQMAVYDNWKD